MQNKLMVQNTILRSRGNTLVVAGNNSSNFNIWLQEYLKEKTQITLPVIHGVLNNFDKREREGVVFRGSLLEFLWENHGNSVICEVA